jgi:hypothetical protein
MPIVKMHHTPVGQEHGRIIALLEKNGGGCHLNRDVPALIAQARVRAARQRWRARQRARETAKSAAERDDAPGGNIAA